MFSSPSLKPCVVGILFFEIVVYIYVYLLCQFELVASGPPTQSDKTALKAITTSQAGIDADNIRNFDVQSSTSRRLMDQVQKIALI